MALLVRLGDSCGWIGMVQQRQLPPSLRDDEPLRIVVERQRLENDGLRAALRYRAVIEQAKGILMARTGMDPESAFRQLVAQSQRTNVKLTQLAAAVVAHTISRGPDEPRGLPTDGQILVDVTSDRAVQRLTAAAVAAAPDFSELLAAVVQHTSGLGVRGGMLAIAEPDGALRLVACHGVAPQELSGWQRLPPAFDVPLCRAAEQREAVWLHDRLDRRQRFPGSERVPGHREGCAAFPLVIDRQLVGSLSLDWDDPIDLREDERAHLLNVAGLCAEPVALLLRRHDEALPDLELEPGYASWFQAVLDCLPAPTLLLEPRLAGDRVQDLVVVFANRMSQPLLGLPPGSSLLESQPDLVRGPLLASVAQALRTAGTVAVGPLTVDRGSGTIHTLPGAMVVRVGTLVVLSWRLAEGHVVSPAS